MNLLNYYTVALQFVLQQKSVLVFAFETSLILFYSLIKLLFFFSAIRGESIKPYKKGIGGWGGGCSNLRLYDIFLEYLNVYLYGQNKSFSTLFSLKMFFKINLIS